MATLASTYKDKLLDQLLRGISSDVNKLRIQDVVLLNAGGGTQLCYQTPGTPAKWADAVNGVAVCTGVPLTCVYQSTGTVSRWLARDYTSTTQITSADGSVGVTGDVGKEVLLDVLTSATPPNIVAFSIGLPDSLSTVKLNTLFRNYLADLISSKRTGVASGNRTGIIEVYSGSPPASADDAPSGTMLVSWTIGTGSSFWNAASGGVCGLNGTPTSNAAAASGTAGYARLKIQSTDGGWPGDLVLLGSVGTDFTINNTTINSGNTYTLTGASIGF